MHDVSDPQIRIAEQHVDRISHAEGVDLARPGYQERSIGLEWPLTQQTARPIEHRGGSLDPIRKHLAVEPQLLRHVK